MDCISVHNDTYSTDTIRIRPTSGSISRHRLTGNEVGSGSCSVRGRHRRLCFLEVWGLLCGLRLVYLGR